ncbi:hypothetical protein [Rhodococcus sp. WMMA185]|nr:hypothetical protein [Rhodococcus sp. WMMA185]
MNWKIPIGWLTVIDVATVLLERFAPGRRAFVLVDSNRPPLIRFEL